jgi:cytochrome c2
VALPTPNRWKRNVRLAGIGFFDDGTAAVSTFDGDVWLVSGLEKGLEKVQWKRFAAGLFEPLNLCVANGKVMVWTRNGLVRLHDRNGDKEADFYETFCHLPPQSAETREFAMSMGLGPDGSFYVSKGAQSTTHQSMLPGTVLRIAPDGGTYEVLGTGLREPFIGVHPRTGAVVASDQQGHWVPSTPVHLIEEGGWYGFYSKRQKPTDRKPNETLIWQPHRKQSSGVGMVWADEERFGPLSGKLLGFDYKNGTVVAMDWLSGNTIGGGWVLDGKLQFGPLHAAVNPVDGQVYVVGFKIWDSFRPALSGLARLRYAGGDARTPVAMGTFTEGIMIRTAEALDPKAAVDRANYAVQRWNYKRTKNYGSGHYLPGTDKAGQAPVPVQSATLSKDGRAVFLRLAENSPAQQLTVDFKAKDTGGNVREYSVWTTVRKTASFVADKHGFPQLRPPEKGAVAAGGAGEVSVAVGKQVAMQFGCIACHSTDGSTEGRSGPSWKGLFGSKREAAVPRKGKAPKAQTANEAYLKTAIVDPTAFVLKGYDKEGVGMPAYAGVLKPHQVDSLITYIKTLK